MARLSGTKLGHSRDRPIFTELTSDVVGKTIFKSKFHVPVWKGSLFWDHAMWHVLPSVDFGGEEASDRLVSPFCSIFCLDAFPLVTCANRKTKNCVYTNNSYIQRALSFSVHGQPYCGMINKLEIKDCQRLSVATFSQISTCTVRISFAAIFIPTCQQRSLINVVTICMSESS